MPSLDLRAARDLAGLSQSELARRAGLKTSAIFDLEAGRVRRPAHETVVRIVRALKAAGLAGITADQLFPVPDGREVA